MWPLTALLLAQVVGCFVAEGILTYDSTNPADYTTDFHGREDPKNNWQTILRSAMFRTLIKYTGFSPSLDVKMEADSLLWNKLTGAKYTRKVPKHDDEGDLLKTGVLIDLSRENGHLEFRQVDKSLYTLEPKDHRLLALWRMRLMHPNHYLIQIKIPEDPPREHFYEFSQTGGLKEMTLKDNEYTKSKQNKNTSWKIRQRKAFSPTADLVPKGNSYSKQPEHYVVRNHQYNGNRYKSPQQTYRNSKSPRTYLYKPTTQYYTVVGIQSPPPVQKFNTWSDYTYQPYSVNPVKDFTEFKQESEYEGFLPSLGPGGSTTVIQESIPNEAVPFKQVETYLPAYTMEPIPPTQDPYSATYFKPSTQFVQYSEADPFYSAQNDSYTSFGVINTAAAGLQLLGQYPLYYNTLPTAAISVQVPPGVEPGKSLYDIAINNLRNENDTQKEGYLENIAQPTATSFTINYTPETESPRQRDYTTEAPQKKLIKVLNPTITEVSQSKTRVKNSLRNPSRTPNSGHIDNYEYAPLYVQWGEKIKPSDKKPTTIPKIRTTTTITTTQKPTTHQPEYLTTKKFSEEKVIINVTEVGTTLDKNKTTEISNKNRNSTVAQTPSERLQELQKRRLSFRTRKQEKHKEEEKINKGKDTNKNITHVVINNSTQPSPNNENAQMSSDLNDKSPEEIVRDYTTMGLQNTTSAEKSENLRNVNARNGAKVLKNEEHDSLNEGSEPVSVVVNRISQSFSVKTSEGESGNLRQPVTKM